MESTGIRLTQTEFSPRRSRESGYGRLYGAPNQYPKDLNEQEFNNIVQNTEVWERKNAYHRLLKAIENNKLPPESLLPFVRHEPNAKLVYKATSQFIQRKSCSLADEFNGVEQIIELYNKGSLRNAGAALAGLLSLGDRRVNALLRLLRPQFSQDTIHEFTRVHPNRLRTSTIEFYFDWIFELQSKRDVATLNIICSAMTVMLFHDENGVVLDHAENNCVGFKQPLINEARFVDYFARIEPALKKLQSDDSPSIHALVTTWYNHKQAAQSVQLAH